MEQKEGSAEILPKILVRYMNMNDHRTGKFLWARRNNGLFGNVCGHIRLQYSDYLWICRSGQCVLDYIIEFETNIKL